jgi:hypothetical protein
VARNEAVATTTAGNVVTIGGIATGTGAIDGKNAGNVGKTAGMGGTIVTSRAMATGIRRRITDVTTDATRPGVSAETIASTGARTTATTADATMAPRA